MRRVSIPTLTALILAAGALFAPPRTLSAHVQLDAPNGGETFTEGDTVTVEWHVVIQHNQLNWDLWYSTTSSNGPWTDIVMDLPPGAFNVGSVHTYDWTIPAGAVGDAVWIRVRMDNSGTDYYDTNDAPFSVQPEFALLLTQGDLVRGQTTTLQADNAMPGETVYFLYSLSGEGAGPCPPQLGGLCLDLLDPIQMAGSAVADFSGTATLMAPIPGGVPLIDVSTQAVIRRGPGGSESVKSNPNTATILP